VEDSEMARKSMTIRTRTIIFSIVLPVVLVLMLAAVIFFLQFNDALVLEKEILLWEARTIASEVRLEVAESFELLRNVAVNPLTIRVVERMGQVPQGLDNDDYQVLEEFEEFREILNLASIGTNAQLVFAASPGSTGVLLGRDVQIGEGFDVRTRDYFQGALEQQATAFISQPRVSAEQAATPIIVVTAAKAVVGSDFRAVGLVALNYQFDPILEIFRRYMAETELDISMYDTVGRNLLWFTSPEGEVFFDPENPIPLTLIAQAAGTPQDDIPAFVNDLVVGEEFYFDGMDQRGATLAQAVRVPGTRWSIIVALPRSLVANRVISSVLPPIAIFVAAILIMQLTVFIIYMRGIVNPLAGIGNNLTALAQADADLTVRVPVKSDDEIGKVASSFNDFIEKLRMLMVEVKEVIDRTDQVKMSVASSAEETSTAIEQISANLDSIGGQIDILDQNISENVTAIEQVTQNIASVDEQIINQSAMVEESTAAITEMIASLGSVNSIAQNKRQTTEALGVVAEEGRSRLEETAKTFKDVVAYINQIQEMAMTISTIASQTNLLSMNAAIEAAHAGDAGRGFAVVAEEIRKLAENAGKSSKTISALIKDITASVRETDENVEQTSEAFQRITKEVGDTINAFSEIESSVSELNVGGQQILDSSNQINEVTVNIRNGSSEIKHGTQAMLDSSSKIKEVSDRVTTGMAESTTGAREIVRSMQLLVQTSTELTQIVNNLKDSFGQFKTETGAEASDGQPSSAPKSIREIEEP
jgi:methyl-accepting chemotaxis protein